MTGAKASFVLERLADGRLSGREVRQQSPFDALLVIIDSISDPQDSDQVEKVRQELFEFLELPNAAELDSFLDRSGRLPEFLQFLGVPESTWKRFVDVARTWTALKSVPAGDLAKLRQKHSELLEALGKRLSFAGSEARSVGLTTISRIVFQRHRIPLRCFANDRNVLFVTSAAPAFGEQELDELQDALRAGPAAYSAVLLIPTADPAVARDSEQRARRGVVILAQEELKKLLLASHLGRALSEICREYIPVHSIHRFAPGTEFDTTAFKGRRAELDLVQVRPEANIAVYGGRRIGKTWFLHKLKESINESPLHEAIYVPLQPVKTEEEAVHEIIFQLRGSTSMPSGSTPVAASSFESLRGRLLRRTDDSKKRLTILFDEVDNLVSATPTFFWKLRDLRNSEPGRFRFIFAGFRALTRACTNSDDPFYNFVGPNKIAMSQLQKEEALSVIEGIREVGYEFDDDDIPSHIYDRTAGHPYFLQYYCQRLLELAPPGKPWKITRDLANKVETDPNFRAELISTVGSNLQPPHRLLLRLLVRDGDLTFAELKRAVRALPLQGLPHSEDFFRCDLDDLCAYSILVQRQEEDRYTFLMPLLREICSALLADEDDFWEVASDAELMWKIR